MKRRLVLQSGALALPTLTMAQGTVPVTVGVLWPIPFPAGDLKDIRDEFARLGWREGANLRIEVRAADGRPERVEALARELVALDPALLLVPAEPSALAIKRHNSRIPIVMMLGFNPVARGLANSLQRPGGSVTGLVVMYDDIRPKLFQLARQLVPKARRFAGLYFDTGSGPNAILDARMESGRQLARQVAAEYVPLPVRDYSQIEAAIGSLIPVQDHVLMVNFDRLLPEYPRIAAIARAAKLASASEAQTYAQLGGLMSYGPDLSGHTRRAVQLADKVLRGAVVGDIPIEQPTLIRLTLNQRTAREIGLALPQELVLRADEVIQ